MPTVDEMKAQADKIGLKYPSKIRKADLAALLDAAMSKTTAEVITRDTPLMDRVGPTAIVTNEGGHTTIDDTHDTGRVFMFPNPEDMPSVESAHRPIDLAVMGNPRERHAARMAKTKTSAVDKTTPNRLVRMVRASQSRRYGQGGRGMGAKHYPDDFRLGRGARRVFSSDATKPLAYGDRVRHYAKQNGQPTAKCDGFPGPLLTAAQWRRIDKKDNVLKFVKFSFATKERRYV